MASLHSPRTAQDALQSAQNVQPARTPASGLFQDAARFAATPLRSYWSPRWLHGFSLRMAGQGLCVNETLMVCDPAYARTRLREACAMDDKALQQMAVEMLASMGPEPDAAAATLSH